MRTTKEYSCVKKTKKAFEQSFVSLAKEMPLNKITVKQICERAEMSRNAFYFHYDDINALITDIEDGMVSDIIAMFDHISDVGFPDNVLTNIQDLTDYFYERKDTTLILLDSSYSNTFKRRMNTAFSDFFFQYFKKYHNTEFRDSYDCFYTFLSNGYCGMLEQWLKNPGKISKRHFIRLTFNFVSRLLVVDKTPELPKLKEEQ